MKKISYNICIIVVGISIFEGCLKDDISPLIPSISLSDNAMLLGYIETNGNYINSKDMPSIMDPDEVYTNLDNYLIIDVRSEIEYSSGHISGAVNILNDSLIEYCSAHNISRYPKVVILSGDGQSSAYYTCLLRIYGFNNVYSLLFGMALWNRVFSDDLIEHSKDNDIIHHLDGSKLYPGNPNYKLPDIQIDLQNNNKQNIVKNLIENIVKEGFDSSKTLYLSPPDTTTIPEGGIKINFYLSGEDISDYYIICVGSISFYIGHLPGAYFYFDNDFKSTTNIQTIPPDKKIVVYSVSGQVSAFVTAYLRLLGYDAKSLLYGGHGYTYSRLTNQNEIDLLRPFVFLSQDIRNYPYITGLSSK